MMSGWGYSESPLVDGDKLDRHAGCGHRGRRRARSRPPARRSGKRPCPSAAAPVTPRPVKARVGDVSMYITVMGKSGGVVAVNADTGKLLWQYTKICNGTANIPTVIARDDLVWCSTGYSDGGSALLKMTADGERRFGQGTEVLRPELPEPPRRHDSGGRLRVLRGQPRPGLPRVRRVQDGRAEVQGGEGRRRRERFGRPRVRRRDALLPLPERSGCAARSRPERG